MKKGLWKITIIIAAVLLCKSSAFTQGLSGWVVLNQNMSQSYEDGELTSESETFNRNINLNFDKPITSMISYQLNLRANWQDADNDGDTSYRRSLDPAIDLFLRNPMYDISAGYRRQEQWTTATLTDEGRDTTEFYYSRFNVAPAALPSLSLQVDRQKKYDYLDEQSIDDTNTSYSASSWYELPSKDVVLRYTINFAHNIKETPLSETFESRSDTFNANYDLGYSDELWKRRADYNISYKGNYSRNKNEQFVTGGASVSIERIPLGGFYIQDITPGDGALNIESELINNDFSTRTTPNINIATGTDHNIGIWIAAQTSVEKIYVYVDQNVTGDANLTNVSNWELYTAGSNLPTTIWSNISSVISSVSVNADTTNNIFRYEINFTTPQSASYIKVVNQAMVSVAGLTDVYVTEIEAYGTDTPDGNVITNVSTSFSQGLVLNASVRPVKKLNIALNYSLDRSDQQPVSLTDSIIGFFGNTVSDDFPDEKEDFTSNIVRNYGATTTWFTHRFLTSSFRLQRNESFDNTGDTDVSSNTYNLSFASDPLPTIDATLSLIRSDTYRFSAKDTTSHSMLFSLGSRLFRDVNMITDVSFTKSESYANDTDSSSQQINGTLDALVTQKLSATFNYNFIWTSTGDTSSDTKEGSTVVTYRPGKFINISSNVSLSDADGDITATEGLILDWLPVKAVRLNANWQHTVADPNAVKTDSFGSYVIWYVTRFADLRLSYNINKQTNNEIDNETTVNQIFNTQLNCRF